MKKNHGAEEERARDLFYALWIPDLFMKRVEADAQWALFCPNEAPGLFDTYGAEFDALYHKYEQTPGKPRKIIRARQLWQQILESQQETGTPYMLFKDAANSKSNPEEPGHHPLQQPVHGDHRVHQQETRSPSATSPPSRCPCSSTATRARSTTSACTR